MVALGNYCIRCFLWHHSAPSCSGPENKETTAKTGRCLLRGMPARNELGADLSMKGRTGVTTLGISLHPVLFVKDMSVKPTHSAVFIFWDLVHPSIGDDKLATHDRSTPYG